MRENLRELRELQTLSRHASADAQLHAAELAKARQDSNDEREARAAKAIWKAQNCDLHDRGLPSNYERILINRLVDHGELWWKKSPDVRLLGN